MALINYFEATNEGFAAAAEFQVYDDQGVLIANDKWNVGTGYITIIIEASRRITCGLLCLIIVLDVKLSNENNTQKIIKKTSVEAYG
jgi:hypothetical protein